MPSASEWERFRLQNDLAAQASEQERLDKIEAIRKRYADKFARDQATAIAERDAEAGFGESSSEYSSRVANVPGVFNDRNQTSNEIRRVKISKSPSIDEAPVIDNTPPPTDEEEVVEPAGEPSEEVAPEENEETQEEAEEAEEKSSSKQAKKTKPAKKTK